MNENLWLFYYHFIMSKQSRYVVGDWRLWRWCLAEADFTVLPEEAMRWKTCLIHPALDTSGCVGKNRVQI